MALILGSENKSYSYFKLKTPFFNKGVTNTFDMPPPLKVLRGGGIGSFHRYAFC